jgi:hypothetical protein
MPFEDVYGNAGLLTTVGDLLRWSSNFRTMKVGGPELVKRQQAPGTLDDGRQLDYGYGLRFREYGGQRVVAHSGSTAGYAAYLLHFPDVRVSVSVLCNVTSAEVERYAYAVAAEYLGNRLKAATPPKAVALPAAVLGARTGLYRSLKTGEPLQVATDGKVLRIGGGQAVPTSATTFVQGNAAVTFNGDGASPSPSLRFANANGTWEEFERVEPVHPDAATLAAYTGVYWSDEVEVSLGVTAEDGALVVLRRPDTKGRLTPVYADAFESPLGLVRFRRDAAGRVTSLSLGDDRAWDVRFEKVGQ